MANGVLNELGFQRSCVDVCNRNGTRYLLILYVDDMLIAAPTGVSVDWIQKALEQRWKMKAVPANSLFVGYCLRRDEQWGTISLHRYAYAREVISRYRLNELRPCRTPMDEGNILSKDDAAVTDDEKREVADCLFPSILGALMWLACGTRADLAQPVFYLARFSADPGPRHCRALKRICRYLVGTVELGA